MSTLSSIDKPIFRYRNAWYMAFYSRRFYVDVCKRWRGLGVGYFLVLMLIASIPLSLRIVYDFNQYFNEQLIEPFYHLPNIYMQNGQMSIDEPMPYLIRNSHQDVVGVIDAKASAQDAFKFYPKLALFINESKIFFKPPKLELFKQAKKKESIKDNIYEDSMYQIGDGIFNGVDWIKSSGVIRLKWYTDAMVLPALTIFFFFLYLTFMFAVAVLGQGIARMAFKVRLKFRESLRLCLTAITAQVIIFFLILTFEINLPYLGWLQVIIFAFYFGFAVFSVKGELKSLVRT